MHNIINKSLFSLLTLFALATLHGCGQDRADTATESEIEKAKMDLKSVKITAKDSDGDGISDEDEINGWKNACGKTYKTDPNKWDSDEDGLKDGLEKTFHHENNCTDPLVKDSDNDGIEDGDELDEEKNDPHITDPTNSDSDGDGIKDGDEVGANLIDDRSPYITDPTVRDSDGDGLDDGYEVFTTQTDPNDQDSDDDNLTDKVEVMGWTNACNQTYKTDPNNQDSDGDGVVDSREKTFKQYACLNPNTKDSDNDGLDDGEELNPEDPSHQASDPTLNDSDGDGLDDGYEVWTSKTDPNEKDSDHDGVTDGIEVCGTSDYSLSRDSEGKIVATNEETIKISEDRDVSNRVLDLSETDKKTITLNGTKCQTPANSNQNDTPDTIDALDPTNDSDGDHRPNINEMKRGTNPLHAGRGSNLITTTDDVTEAVRNNYYYPWVTQTTHGDEMVKAGFVYVPKANSKGFWISKYEARYKNNDFTTNAVVFTRDSNHDGHNDGNVNDVTIDNAKTLLASSNSEIIANYPLQMLTRDQYRELFAVKADTPANTGCINIKNSVGDTNMPTDSIYEVCEITDSNKEFVTSTDGKYNYNSNCTSGSCVLFTDDTLSASDTTFRGATSYIK